MLASDLCGGDRMGGDWYAAAAVGAIRHADLVTPVTTKSPNYLEHSQHSILMSNP